MMMRKMVMARHSGDLANGVRGGSGSQGPVLLTAPHLEEANKDTECGGHLHPSSISGRHINSGVRGLQEGFIWSQ